MIISDYPEIKADDYKIPNGVPPEIMIELSSSDNPLDHRLHDYLVLIGSGKFTKKQINRALYITRYGAYRLRKKCARIMKNVANQ